MQQMLFSRVVSFRCVAPCRSFEKTVTEKPNKAIIISKKQALCVVVVIIVIYERETRVRHARHR